MSPIELEFERASELWIDDAAEQVARARYFPGEECRRCNETPRPADAREEWICGTCRLELVDGARGDRA